MSTQFQPQWVTGRRLRQRTTTHSIKGDDRDNLTVMVLPTVKPLFRRPPRKHLNHQESQKSDIVVEDTPRNKPKPWEITPGFTHTQGIPESAFPKQGKITYDNTTTTCSNGGTHTQKWSKEYQTWHTTYTVENTRGSNCRGNTKPTRRDRPIRPRLDATGSSLLKRLSPSYPPFSPREQPSRYFSVQLQHKQNTSRSSSNTTRTKYQSTR